MIGRINNVIEDLTDPNIELTSTLLKVQVLAHKLKNDKLKEWVNNEVNGYEDDNKISTYRIIQTIVKGHLMHGQMNYTNIQLSVQGIKEKNNIDLNEFELSQSASPMVHFKDYSEALGMR